MDAPFGNHHAASKTWGVQNNTPPDDFGMNQSAFTDQSLSVEDYLRNEEVSEIRHEYLGGKIYPRDDASMRHCLITGSLISILLPASRIHACRCFASAFKLKLDNFGETTFYYPDLMVVCKPKDRHPLYATQPSLIIEVLSETTERIVRREKILAYQTLPSLQEYVFVAQDYPQIEIYRRRTVWLPEVHAEGAFTIECLDLTASVAEVYQDIGGFS
ncbi:Uma2 family endonuclease [Halothiobacillus sp.]|uniref:Uma2 family endonuclease n=1 Tax=Halothiobacillus sp. TaxID=1891311 RepID=UPI0026150566|nr:Uma2 family endonuclease [Halothiobacillus sp.]